jgi:hypothetical protein
MIGAEVLTADRAYQLEPFMHASTITVPHRVPEKGCGRSRGEADKEKPPVQRL